MSLRGTLIGQLHGWLHLLRLFTVQASVMVTNVVEHIVIYQLIVESDVSVQLLDARIVRHLRLLDRRLLEHRARARRLVTQKSL